MKLYLNFISNSIKKNIIYRFNVWTKLLGRLMYFFVQVSVWKALYTSEVTNNTDITIKSMLMYVTVSNVINVVVEFNIIEFLNDKIRDGNISLDLIKPFRYITYIFCYGIGENIVNFFTQSIPIVFCSTIFLRGQINYEGSYLYFFISLAIAMVISFLFAYWMGLLAFFFTVTWPLNMLLKSIYKLLSGMWIPIWLFSDTLQNLNSFLPFQYIYYVPISILTVKEFNVFNAMLVQIIWCGILCLLVYITWRIGRKKLVIQGG